MPDDKIYKSLEIDKANMNGWIQGFCAEKEYKINSLNVKENGQTTTYKVDIDKYTFTVCLFESNGNRYTISYNRGINQNISKEFADYVVDRLGTVNKDNDNNKGYCLNLDEKDFIAFFELLYDEAKENEIVNHSEGEKHIQYKLKSKQYNDEIMIHYYRTAKKIFIQGKRLQLFNKATDILAGTCELCEVVNAEIRYDSINISSEQVITEMKEAFGEAYDFVSNTQKAIMSNSFKFYRVKMELDDYSVLVQPMCRAMEGYIYKLLKKVGITVNDDNSVGYFYYRENDSNPLTLRSQYVSIISNETIVRELNKIYKWYYKNRHQYAHSRDRDFVTSIIKDRAVADSLFKEAIDLYKNVFWVIDNEKRKE